MIIWAIPHDPHAYVLYADIGSNCFTYPGCVSDLNIIYSDQLGHNLWMSGNRGVVGCVCGVWMCVGWVSVCGWGGKSLLGTTTSA